MVRTRRNRVPKTFCRFGGMVSYLAVPATRSYQRRHAHASQPPPHAGVLRGRSAYHSFPLPQPQTQEFAFRSIEYAMTAKEKVVFCWSGGKDSALCLHHVLESGRYEVLCLLTTVNEEFQRVSMHGVRTALLERQAAAIGLPLEKVLVSRGGSNAEYEERMAAALDKYQALGANTVIFGDIFLEDLRRWREDNLAKIGMRALFPLWKRDTRELIGEFLALGFASVICCVNDAWLDETAVGQKIDADFIRGLPPGVDPCGENGEFHSFAYAGPIFQEPLQIQLGEKVYRPLEANTPSGNISSSSTVCPPPEQNRTKGFWFCDLLTTEMTA